jgi:transcriptional regulator GlxA family with amidase domain
VRGLADCRLAAAIHGLHDRPEHAWTVGELAKEAALSRSTFFERFGRAVGIAPMRYRLAWRMALAKDLLRFLVRTGPRMSNRQCVIAPSV